MPELIAEHVHAAAIRRADDGIVLVEIGNVGQLFMHPQLAIAQDPGCLKRSEISRKCELLLLG